ncbi:bifunctional protein FolD 1, mitochondrial isoform X2 [Nicotiana tabacum]|uniref:Bifunctional protein FolD 1, mitochondrial isoform X2 n=2 Tax=Nicotiana tabacum TaxID=4097 RepID=A0A1S3ZV08_TOBAC|nr:bifunctional protein FolD 1, mitochondrial isoform X2 [Nicotiana tomentosiformis]XP_016468153.1 PREDICTED: bifunctional protein FolD 1, mitochondrial-like isoform X2 [Nicotiana tabacum]
MVGMRMIRRVVPLLSRPLSTTQIRNGSRIPKSSPPLVSLDLPDEWSSNFTHSDSPPPSPKYTDNATARIIDGISEAEQIRASIAVEVSRMKESTGKVPGLAVVLVGQRQDSLAYVRKKIMACHEVGFRFSLAELPESCTEEEICDALSNYNKDASIHGILVQLPLPQHFDEGKILNVLSLEKDVDGFHPLNIGNLAIQGREPLFIPCTPKGCIELLLRSDVEIAGKRAVVIGRSNIVGLPAFLLLQRHHATVSIVHAYSENPEMITREADILVAAAGVPNLVRGSWLKPGAVVLDVGINPIEDLESENGYRLIGDVCFDEAVKIASAITPVPGGVGPMTVAMLLQNTLEAAKRALHLT